MRLVIFTGSWISENEIASLGGLEIDFFTKAPKISAGFRSSVEGILFRQPAAWWKDCPYRRPVHDRRGAGRQVHCEVFEISDRRNISKEQCHLVAKRGVAILVERIIDQDPKGFGNPLGSCITFRGDILCVNSVLSMEKGRSGISRWRIIPKSLLNRNNRRKYAAEFINGFDKRVPKSMKQLDKIRRTPMMKLAKPVLTYMQKDNHYGQVVPMEDVEKIFDMVQGAVRLPCVCRRVTTGNMNARYCYGLTMDKELMDLLMIFSALKLSQKRKRGSFI